MAAPTKPNPEKQRVVMVNSVLWKRVTAAAKKAKISASELARRAFAAYLA